MPERLLPRGGSKADKDSAIKVILALSKLNLRELEAVRYWAKKDTEWFVRGVQLMVDSKK